MNPTTAITATLVFCLVTSLSGLSQSAETGGGKNYTEPVLLKQSEALLSRPADLAISPEGTYLLIADTGNNEIKVLQPGTLKHLSSFGGGTLVAPQGIEFTVKGELMVVDDGGTRVTTYIFKGVNRDGSAKVKRLQATRDPQMRPANPRSVSDPNGLRYEVSRADNHVAMFDPDRRPLGIYGNDILNTPGAVETVGRYFWIADTGNNRILLLKAPQPRQP